MDKQKKHYEWSEKISFWKKIRKWILATAIWATLIAWASACDSGKWSEMGKDSDKKETIMKPQTEVQTDTVMFTGEQKNWSDIESDIDSQDREVVSTKEYDDEKGRHITKKTYEDGSWSIEREEGRHYFYYTEYYPNNNVKFERNDFWEWNWTHEWVYTIYDEKGKILFYDECLIEEVDGIDLEDKCEQWRIVSERFGRRKYTYDDKNKLVKVVDNRSTVDGHKYKIVTVYSMWENGEKDEEWIISNVFIWETWKEIDLMNWWIEKLIKDMHLENIPYINEYEIFHTNE